MSSGNINKVNIISILIFTCVAIFGILVLESSTLIIVASIFTVASIVDLIINYFKGALKYHLTVSRTRIETLLLEYIEFQKRLRNTLIIRVIDRLREESHTEDLLELELDNINYGILSRRIEEIG